jgi:hypothetical protein
MLQPGLMGCTIHYRPSRFQICLAAGFSGEIPARLWEIFSRFNLFANADGVGQPGRRSRTLGQCADLLTIAQFCAKVAPGPQGMISFVETPFSAVPMKFRLLGAGVAAAASLLVPQQAHALVATTQYVPFKIFQNPALNGPTFPLSFQNFNTAFGGDTSGLTLSGIGFKIAGASDGTGSATVAGNPRVTNQSEDFDRQAFVQYAPKFSFTNGTNTTGPITATTTNATSPVPCVSAQSCPNPGGGTTIPMNSTRTLNLAGNTYAGTGGFASIAMQNAWRNSLSIKTATATGTPSANFTGTGDDMAYNFDPTLSTSVVSKPYIEGWIAIQYEYEVIPSAVPGPLPLFGAAAAFGWSRRLKKRISSAA